MAAEKDQAVTVIHMYQPQEEVPKMTEDFIAHTPPTEEEKRTKHHAILPPTATCILAANRILLQDSPHLIDRPNNRGNRLPPSTLHPNLCLSLLPQPSNHQEQTPLPTLVKSKLCDMSSTPNCPP